MEPTWGQSGADRTQLGPCWPHEFCYLGYVPISSLPLKPRHIMALYHTFLFLLYGIMSFIALFIKNTIHLYFNVEKKLPGYVATRWSIVKNAKGCKRNMWRCVIFFRYHCHHENRLRHDRGQRPTHLRMPLRISGTIDIIVFVYVCLLFWSYSFHCYYYALFCPAILSARRSVCSVWLRQSGVIGNPLWHKDTPDVRGLIK